MFLVAQTGNVEFRVPPELAVGYAGMICCAAVSVLNQMVLVFGLNGDMLAHWDAVKSRADVALKRMQTMFP